VLMTIRKAGHQPEATCFDIKFAFAQSELIPRLAEIFIRARACGIVNENDPPRAVVPVSRELLIICDHSLAPAHGIVREPRASRTCLDRGQNGLKFSIVPVAELSNHRTVEGQRDGLERAIELDLRC